MTDPLDEYCTLETQAKLFTLPDKPGSTHRYMGRSYLGGYKAQGSHHQGSLTAGITQ